MRLQRSTFALRLAVLLALPLLAAACVDDDREEFVETPEAGEEVVDDEDGY